MSDRLASRPAVLAAACRFGALGPETDGLALVRTF